MCETETPDCSETNDRRSGKERRTLTDRRMQDLPAEVDRRQGERRSGVPRRAADSEPLCDKE